MIKKLEKIRKLISKKIRDKIKNETRYFLARMRLFLLLKKNGVGLDTWIFFMPCSIGDVIFLCSLISAFKAKNGGRVAVVVNKNNQKIATMFRDICFPISLGAIKFDYEANFRISNSAKIKKGKIFIPHSIMNRALSDFSSLHLLDAYKLALGLDPQVKMSEPDFSVYDLGEAKNFLKKENFDHHKTIILFPFAQTVAGISESFWETLVSELINSGFNILVNTKGGDEFLSSRKNILRINKSLDEVLALGLVCAGVISLRSGIADFFAISSKKLVVFYPDQASYKSFNFLHALGQRENLLEVVIKEKFSSDVNVVRFLQ